MSCCVALTLFAVPGDWYLTDFGSVCKFGETAPCSAEFYTRKVAVAAAEVDLCMLAVSMLCVKLGPESFIAGLFQDGLAHVDQKKVLNMIQGLVQNAEWSAVGKKLQELAKTLPPNEA